jgi:sugar phosphate isomerase/epimerase
VDFAALSGALDAIGYNRAVTIELEYEEAHPPRITTDLRRAKAVIEAAFAAFFS